MKFLHNKSLFKTLLFSQLTILGLSVIITAFILISSTNEIERTTQEFAEISINQISDSLLRIEQDLREVANNIQTRQEYESLTYSTGELTNIKREKIKDLQTELFAQSTYSDYISAIYIWFPNSEMATTTSGFLNDYEGLDQTLLRDINYSLEDIYNCIETSDKNFSIHLSGVQGDTDTAICVYQNYTSNSTLSPIIIFKINLSALTALLETETGDTTFWIKSNYSDNYIYSNANTNFDTINVLSNNLTESSIDNVKYEDNSYAVFSVENQSNFTVYSSIHLNQYLQTKQNFLIITLCAFAIYLIIAVVCAVILTKKNYKPIERINNLVVEKTGQSVLDNDLAMLETGINSLLKISKNYEHTKIQEKKLIKEDVIKSLLTNEFSKEELTKLIIDNNINFATEHFNLIAISLLDYNNIFLDKKNNLFKKEDKNLAYIVINSVATEMFSEIGIVNICTMREIVWILFSSYNSQSLSDKQIQEKIVEVSTRCEKFLIEEIGVATSYYISRPYKNFEPVSTVDTAYNNSLWALEQIQSYSMHDLIISYEDIVKFIKTDEVLTPDVDLVSLHRQFNSSVVAGDFKEALSLYLKLRKECIAFADNSFQSIKMQTIVLAGYLISNMPNQIIHQNSQEINEYTSKIRIANTDEMLVDLMKGWMEYCHSLYVSNDEIISDEVNYAREIALYINDHYSDEDISVSEISRALNLSTSYLSREFKKEYDMSILTYIHKRRIDTVKMILRDETTTIETIAKQVGYSNTLALIRAFKRSENCTPTEYRKSLHHKT